MHPRNRQMCKGAVPIAIATLLTANLAYGEYWVSIGAYRAVEAAEQLAVEASSEAPVAFTARVADTAEGSIYRVVAGPFATRGEAQTSAARVREAGYDDAWVADFGAAALMAPGPSLDRTIDSAIDTDFEASLDDWSLDDDLPPIEVLLQGLPDMPAAENAPATQLETAEPAAPVVVPENYRLNRLRREARTLPRQDREGGMLAAFDARVKWYTSARSLPAGDTHRAETGKSTPVDHNADLRLMWRPALGPVQLHVDHSTVWQRNDAMGRSPGLTFDQTATGDERRALDLTWGGDNATGNTRRLHRFDRLAAEYRTRRWGVTVGRQALSWGGGLAFQPMDLFNPFSPTTVDQDYKAGDDMILVERLFPDGSDLQVLVVGRRALAHAGRLRGDVEWDASSLAAKYRTVMGENELELMAAEHYGEQVVGAGLRIPIGGALVRSDIIWTRVDGRVNISGLVNADYTFGVAGGPVHVFGEFFHNGLGVSRLPEDLANLPGPLLERVSVRRELFNLMKNYLAAGASFRWHYLLNQSVAVIANLHDSSYVAQTSLTYDSGDASRLQVGLAKPFGAAGDEFGTLSVGDDLSVGGGDQGFLRYVHYF